MCDVCGSNARTSVCASAVGPISFAYCDKCLEDHAEPVGALAVYLSAVVGKGTDLAENCDNISPAYQLIIDNSLAVAGKTRTEFYALVDTLIEDYESSFQS